MRPCGRLSCGKTIVLVSHTTARKVIKPCVMEWPRTSADRLTCRLSSAIARAFDPELVDGIGAFGRTRFHQCSPALLSHSADRLAV
jgi:hypothetical protein